MIRTPMRPLRLAAILALASVAGACALLASPEPVQMYRFGTGYDIAPAAPAAATHSVSLQMRRIELPQAARGDRILGVRGVEAAYIKGARWVSPAELLYAESLGEAFAAQSSRIRVIGRRELAPVTQMLDVDVTTFEARYGAGEAPEVVITARARMLSMPSRTLTAEQTFSVRRPAGVNRIGAIVEAFEAASRELNAQVVAWADGAAPG